MWYRCERAMSKECLKVCVWGGDIGTGGRVGPEALLLKAACGF